MKADLNWHRHHGARMVHEPYPWKRVGFALVFTALCLVGSVIAVVW